jgi:hypothetical protein
MQQTRSVEDTYTSIKVPDSLRRQLRMMAARKDKYIYQVIAEMILNEIERNEQDI